MSYPKAISSFSAPRPSSQSNFSNGPSTRFSPSNALVVSILGQFLGYSQGGGPFRALLSNPKLSLAEVFKGLSDTEQALLRRQCSPQELALFENLLHRSHFESQTLATLYRYGQDCLRRNNTLQAQCIFENIVEYTAAHGQNSDLVYWGKKSRERLSSLSDTGTLLDRFEHHAPSFLKSLVDPWSIAGFALGSTAYRWTSTRSLRALLGPWGRKWAGTPLGPRALSKALGVNVEAGVFLSISKTGHGLSGIEQNWELRSLGKEYLRTITDLSLIKSGVHLGKLGGKQLTSTFKLSGHGAPQILSTLGAYGGLLLSHPIGIWGTWNSPQSWNQVLENGLVTLLHQQVAGKIADGILHQAVPGFRAYREKLEKQAEALSQQYWKNLNLTGFLQELSFGPQFAWSAAGTTVSLAAPRTPQPLDSLSLTRERLWNPNPIVTHPPLGLAKAPRESTLATRQATQEALRPLLRETGLTQAEVQDVQLVQKILSGFTIPNHPLEIHSFQAGVRLAQQNRERAQSIAFDVDEVYLHWSFRLADMFRGLFSKNKMPELQNTPREFLERAPRDPLEGPRLPWYLRFWLDGVQKARPTLFRQHMQFHPGIRAFQLGLRLGQERNLTMVTTGPAGRVMLLANEDPAFKMIYFGKLPGENVSLTEVQQARNVYTRQDLVEALRTLRDSAPHTPPSPQIEDYLATLRRHPHKAHKLKHGALSELRNKNPFSILVDDSGATYDMLKDANNFVVLKVPSARKQFHSRGVLNMNIGSPSRYLDRMPNNYVTSLAQILERSGPLSSDAIEPRPCPIDYPLQRFAVEIPWPHFAQDFIYPMAELKNLGKAVLEPPKG